MPLLEEAGEDVADVASMTVVIPADMAVLMAFTAEV
jgi:hypothetical protein